MNDHIPNNIAKCEGKKLQDPVFPFWHKDCLRCIRRIKEMQNHENHIAPWEGHGPCPDKLEMEH